MPEQPGHRLNDSEQTIRAERELDMDRLSKLLPKAIQQELAKYSDLEDLPETIEFDNYLMGGVNLSGMLAEDRRVVIEALLNVDNLLLMPRGDDYLVFWYFGAQSEAAEQIAQQLAALKEGRPDLVNQLVVSIGQRVDVPLVYDIIRLGETVSLAQRPVVSPAVVDGALGAKADIRPKSDDLPILLMSDQPAELSFTVKEVQRHANWYRPAAGQSETKQAVAQGSVGPATESLPPWCEGLEFGSFLPLEQLRQYVREGRAALSSVIQGSLSETDRNLAPAIDLAGMSRLVGFVNQVPSQRPARLRALDAIMSAWQTRYTQILLQTGFHVNEYGGDGAMAVATQQQDMISLIHALFAVENSFLSVWSQLKEDEDDVGKFIRQFEQEYPIPIVKVAFGSGDSYLEWFEGEAGAMVRLQVQGVDFDFGMNEIKQLWQKLPRVTNSPDDPQIANQLYHQHQIVWIDEQWIKDLEETAWNQLLNQLEGVGVTGTPYSKTKV